MSYFWQPRPRNDDGRIDWVEYARGLFLNGELSFESYRRIARCTKWYWRAWYWLTLRKTNQGTK